MKYSRKCTHCNSGMNNGYVINDGEEYYCNDKCLHSKYSIKEWEEMSSDKVNSNSMENYWTEWEDDYEYEIINKVLIQI